MTKGELKDKINKLKLNLEELNDRVNKVALEIKFYENELNKMKSIEIAPDILNPLIGKIIVINTSKMTGWKDDKDFMVIKLLSWEIDKDSSSMINLYYEEGVWYKDWKDGRITISSLNKRDELGKLEIKPYGVYLDNLKYVYIYEGSEIQKNHNSIDIHFK